MCASDIIAFSALTTRKRARLSGKPPHPWVPYKVCRARAARRAAAGLKEGDSVFPSWLRGVATPLIKCREAFSERIFFLKARPPLLCQEGNNFFHTFRSCC